MDNESQIRVNLRVLAKVKAGDRIQTVDSRYFGIDRGYWQFFTRWIRSDNRSNTVDRIEETFRQAEKLNLPPTLIDAAKKGVRELCATYVNDDTTVSRLETIVNAPDEEKAF